MNKKSYNRWYRQTEAGKAARERAAEKYSKSGKRKVDNKKYRQTEKGRATYKRSRDRYRQTEKGRTTQLKYAQSEKGRLVAANAAKYSRKHNQKCRNIVITHYGGDPPKCACCGESHYEFLTIDHVNGGGDKDRKARGSGSNVYHSLIKDGFPPGLRVLCYNCHLALGFSGYCPHQPRPG